MPKYDLVIKNKTIGDGLERPRSRSGLVPCPVVRLRG